MPFFVETKMTLNSKQQEFSKRMTTLPLDTFRIEDLDDAIVELATAVGKVRNKNQLSAMVPLT